MKPVMALNGILQCSDLQLMCTMNRILDELAIDTRVCSNLEAAVAAIWDGLSDCVICEWSEDTPALIHELRGSPLNHRAFVIAIVGTAAEMKAAFAAGANLAVQKNLSAENVMRSMRAAYGFLIRQRRHATRVPVCLHTNAKFQGRSVPVTVVDISTGGLCLQSDTPFKVHDSIQIGIPLPLYQTAIAATGKILWVKGNRAGIKFSFIPPRDFTSLTEFIGLQTDHPHAFVKVGPGLPGHAQPAHARV